MTRYLLTGETRAVVYLDMTMVRYSTSLKMRKKHMIKQGFPEAAANLDHLLARVTEIRAAYREVIKKDAKNWPIVQAAQGVFGFRGGRWLLRLLYYIDLDKCPSPAHLWSFCGYGLHNGQPDTMATLTWKTPHRWNREARLICDAYRVYFFNKHSQYNTVLLAKRSEYTRAGYNGSHARIKALRFVTKLFLKHLWQVMRIVEGLPNSPHPADKLYPRHSFGWLV